MSLVVNVSTASTVQFAILMLALKSPVWATMCVGWGVRSIYCPSVGQAIRAELNFDLTITTSL
jgi:hypothetical protein